MKKIHLFPKSSIQPTPTHHDDKNHYLCHRKRRTSIVENKFETKRNNSKQLCGYYLKFVDFQYKKMNEFTVERYLSKKQNRLTNKNHHHHHI